MLGRIYLTIDTEDDYFTPHMLTGEGIGDEFGAYGILDILDRHGLQATWFVNVYEAHRHEDPNTSSDWSKRSTSADTKSPFTPIPPRTSSCSPGRSTGSTPDQQKRILGYGAELIESWTGKAPVSFRAGGYVLNDETFEALESLGFRIDSSVFFSSDRTTGSRPSR